jgi:RNA recognition motif-containing protein
MTEYDPYMDQGGYLYSNHYASAFTTRRSNSRSGYRLFARVANRGAPSGSSRMPPRESVYNFFSQFGVVLDCYLPESATNVAYLCFDDEHTMERVLALPDNVLCIEGVYVTLSRASPRPDYSMNETDRIFVKNVPENTTRTSLRNYFSQFGVVTDVYIPKDKVTGEQKKFAFVTFADVEAARNAIVSVDSHRLVHIDRVSSLLTTSPLQVMPAEPRPMSTPLYHPSKNRKSSWVSTDFSSFSLSGEPCEDAFTTASSTFATNTPTGAGISAEAAASVLISALSQLASAESTPNGSPSFSPSDEVSSSSTAELDEIIARLSSLSLPGDSCTPGLPTPGTLRASPAISDLSDTSVLTQLIEETLSRQTSDGGNIFEQFLNPPTHWESRE